MEIVSISHISLERLKNAEHVQLHTNIRGLITSAGLDAMGLPELVFTPYRNAIEAEQDIVNRATGSAFTLEMQDADNERDRIFKRIRRKLELCELEDMTSIAYKATAVVKKHLLSKYPNAVTYLPNQEETATLAGFILDCRELLSEEQLEGIGIVADLDDLEAANMRFGQMYQERVGEKAAGDTQLGLKLRAATDEAYQLVTFSLNALGNDPTPANATKVNAVRTLIGKVNVVIKEAKDRLNQRVAPSDSPKGEGQDVSDGQTNGGSNNGSNTGSGNTNTGSGSGNNTGNGGTTTPPGIVIVDPDDVIE